MSDQMRVRAILRGSEVRRFHQYPTIGDNTVGHHSHGVACWALMIMDMTPLWTDESRLRIVTAALYHDLAEYVVGDVPSPIKRNRRVRDTMDALEEEVEEEAGLSIRLTIGEKFILKAADFIDGYVFCTKQYHLGNQFLYDVSQCYLGYIRDICSTHPSEEDTRAVNELVDLIKDEFDV